MPEFPKVFPKCPACHSDKTLASEAALEAQLLVPERALATDITLTPLPAPNNLALPNVKCLLVMYDICAKCGTRRCVRSDVMAVPAAQLQGSVPFKGMPSAPGHKP